MGILETITPFSEEEFGATANLSRGNLLGGNVVVEPIEDA